MMRNDMAYPKDRATPGQVGRDFARLSGKRNFWFHIGGRHATLRASGVEVGIGDFDRFHDDAPGFSCIEGPDARINVNQGET